MKKLFLFLLFFFTFIFPVGCFAKIGVGVGTGEIRVEERLKSGMSYQLPVLNVLNTGDEPSDYEVSVAYHQNQEELAPSQKWFDFSPPKFYLEPGEVQIVDIKLDLPLRTEPGEYFAYLEGHPAKKSQSGNTSIGVAAAAKLYFTVEPANIFQAVYFKILGLWQNYNLGIKIATGLLVLLGIVSFLRKFFNIKIDVSKKAKNEKGKAKSDGEKDE